MGESVGVSEECNGEAVIDDCGDCTDTFNGPQAMRGVCDGPGAV